MDLQLHAMDEDVAASESAPFMTYSILSIPPLIVMAVRVIVLAHFMKIGMSLITIKSLRALCF